MANETRITKSGKSTSTKYPAGPVNLHKSNATGASLSEATSEAKVGGSKSDKSRGTNK